MKFRDQMSQLQKTHLFVQLGQSTLKEMVVISKGIFPKNAPHKNKSWDFFGNFAQIYWCACYKAGPKNNGYTWI